MSAHEKIVRAWKNTCKEASRRGIDKAWGELWHIQAPSSCRALNAGAVQIQVYPALDTSGADIESDAHDWIADAKMAAEMYGGKHGFELSFFLNGDAVSRVKMQIDGGAEGQASGAGGGDKEGSHVAVMQVNQSNVLVKTVEMLIKHTDQMQKMQLENQRQIHEFNANQFSRLGARIEFLENDRQRMILMQEEILTTKQERELAALSAQRKEKRFDTVFEKGIVMGTAFLQNMANGFGGKARSTAVMVSLKNFVESMDSATLEKMMAPLSDDQKILIFEMISGAQDAIEEDQKPKEKPANDAKNGAAHKNGAPS